MTLLLFLSGCGSSGSQVAATVNGEVITEREVDQRMAKLSPQVQASFGSDKGRLLEEMITERILLQEARRRGLEKDPEVRRLLEDAKRQLMVGRLLEVLREDAKGQISEKQIAEFYEKNQASFRVPETYRASHILVESEETAKKALERVKSGEPFAKVAEEVSTDPSKSRGGDIGFFSGGQVIPEFEAACKSLKPGEISKVVKTSLGYHVILLTEMRSARQKPLEEAREQIRQALLNQQGQKHVESVLQGLRSQSQIKIRKDFAPSLPSAPAEAPAATAEAPAQQQPSS